MVWVEVALMAEVMAQDMEVEPGAEVIAAAQHAEVLLAVEADITQQQRCHLLAVGLAITHKRRRTSMLVEEQVSLGCSKFLHRPDPTIVSASPFRFA